MSYTPHSADSIRLFRAESSIPARNDQPYAADTQETVGFFRVKIPGKNHQVSSASTTRTKSSGFFLCLKNTGKYLLYVKTRTIITKGSRALQTCRKPSGFFALKSPTKIIGFLLRQQPAQNHRVFFVLEKHREISALRKNPHNNNQGFPRSADMQEAVGLSGMFRLFSEDKVE